MRTIEIIEDTSLDNSTATLAEATWNYIKQSDVESAFFPVGREIVVGNIFEGPRYLIRIVAEGHPEDELRVSAWVKQTFYPGKTNITLA